ncbi:MAG: acyl-CoA dehydrogenase family protein [Candidatus Tectomicrobia bacterium]|nr:acyl-CoA dehydrogenase family protein [Candidatus Tectomicrobia bacterium]
MDLMFTSGDKAWRDEIRDFLDKELPQEQKGGGRDFSLEDETPERVAFREIFVNKLVEKGWYTMGWPVEYGGQNARPIKMAVYNEEMAYNRAPASLGGGLAGAFMAHGTPEQKAKWIPAMASGDVVTCLGYSEPEAGSDLASLQCRAVLDGDEYVVNGQKHFTSNAQNSTHIDLLVRSDPDAPKYRGISRFIVDLKSPGVTVRPQWNMSGRGSRQNETFFDNVRVPKENMIGTLNQAWYEYNRDTPLTSVGQGTAGTRRAFDEFLNYCRETKRNGVRLIDDQLNRSKLTTLLMELEVMTWIYWRRVSQAEKDYGKPRGDLGGGIHDAPSSIPVLIYKEWVPRFADTAMQIAGPLGQIKAGSKWTQMGGWVERYHRAQAFNNHPHGTPEIHRMVVAIRGLGLPR